MIRQTNRTSYKQIALALSLCALLLWGALGTGASLAWFSDTSPDIQNVFHFADFELEVSHRLSSGEYVAVDSQTAIFDDTALYEPGYTQVAYLKMKNKGDRAFVFDTAVTVDDYTPGTNVFRQPFLLQDYLKFGIVTADTEAALLEKVSTRAKAQAAATARLGNYTSDTAQLEAGKETYMALVVYMPQETGNHANYRGQAPTVKLGVIIEARQLGMPNG